MDVLVVRPASAGKFDALTLDRELKAVCSKVQSVTVAHHCDPHAVFVHVTDSLTPEERQAVETVVAEHRAT